MKFESVRSIALSLFNKHAWLALSFASIHQLSIAISVYASVQIIYEVNSVGFDSVDFKLWAVVYLTCMVLPYCVSYFSDMSREAWLCSALNDFWSSATAIYGSCTNKTDTDNIKGILVSQGKETIISFIGYSFHSISALLNFSLSLLVISVVLDYRFALSILVSALFIAAYKVYISKTMEWLSETRNTQGSILTKKLSAIHENYHHGSSINRDSFQSDTRLSAETYLSSRMREARSKYAAMLLTSLFSLLPTTSLVVFLLFSPQIDAAIKLGIVVNLTRIYHLLASANELVSIIILLPNIKGQLRLLTKFNDNKAPFKIDTHTIELKDNQTNKPVSANELQSYRNGYLSVIGSNGSGKTTYLKDYQRSSGALYFNPSYRVCWPWESELNKEDISDGEYTKKCLDWLLNHTQETLLLDEWDAFLDKKNKAELEEKIEPDSKTRLILQVRQ